MKKVTFKNFNLLMGLFFISAQVFGQFTINITKKDKSKCGGDPCGYDGPTILINEVMISPSSGDGSLWEATNTQREGEWIELFNPDWCHAVDISCYFLGNNAYDAGMSGGAQYGGGFQLPVGTIVPPLGFCVVRGRNAPPVPSSLLVSSGGNTIEIVISDYPTRCCIGAGGNRLWFPNSGGWFAFYDENGVPQDGIMWGWDTSLGGNPFNNYTNKPCNPKASDCTYKGDLGIPVNFPKARIDTIKDGPITNTGFSFSRMPDGGPWDVNNAGPDTYGDCNKKPCPPPPDVSCDGEATVNITGGTAPFTYLWDDKQIGSTAKGLCAGVHCVTVTDNTGSTQVACVTINDAPKPVLSLTGTNIKCWNDNNGAINLNITTGNTPSNTIWSDGKTGSSINPNQTINNLAPGTYQVTVTDAGNCTGTASITITQPPELKLNNIVEDCNQFAGPEYGVSFDILGGTKNYSITGNGTPGTFNPPANDHWESGPITDKSTYYITVTDNNGCTKVISGTEDCACEDSAGTMKDIDSTRVLCEDQSLTETNLNDHTLDKIHQNDILEYILHTNSGGILGTIIDRNKTGTFSFKPGAPYYMKYDSVYYISAVVGHDPGTGLIDLTDLTKCLDVAFGTPVIWKKIPVISAGADGNTCSNTYPLNGSNDVGKGMWTSTPSGIQFFPNFNDPKAVIILSKPGEKYTLTWTVTNGPCIRSDEMDIIYNETPVAYAGKDDDICGLEYTLKAVKSLSGSTGKWSTYPSSLPGVLITSPTNSETIVKVPDYGSFGFVWTEDNFSCIDSDFVLINFLKIPTPDAGDNDTVCFGASIPSFQLKVISDTNVGLWTGPLGTFFTSPTSPTTFVDPPSFSTPDSSFWFKWTENNGRCTGSDSVRITFAKKPTAKAGTMQIVCGSTLCLKANILGSEFATGTWTSIPGVKFDDVHSPTACATISDGIFKDTSSAKIPFIWIMDNKGCTEKDTVWNYFYQRPEADAYFLEDDTVKVCGLNFNMNTDYSIKNSQGEWAIIKYPSNVSPAGVNFKNKYDPKSLITVPDTGYYSFSWTEENILYPICSSVDTIVIRFLCQPDIDAGSDTTVCGDSIQLDAISDCGTGAWVEDLDVWISDSSDTHPWTGPVDGANDEYIYYVWKEYYDVCVEVDTVKIYFGRIPEPILACKQEIYNCGLTTTTNNQLKSLSQFGYPGYWTAPATSGETYSLDSSKQNVYVTVPDYGRHVFYRCENNKGCIGCSDSVVIYFIEIPQADAGGGFDNADTACGLNFDLHALPSIPGAIGTWSTECNAVFKSTGDKTSNLPNDSVISNKNQTCILVWTEDNSHECVDADTLKLTFAPIPNNNFTWEMPDCIGDTAMIMGAGWNNLPPSDTLPTYTWDFGLPGTFVLDKYYSNIKNGMSRCWVHWTNGELFHIVKLTTINSFGCSSNIWTDTVWEPKPIELAFDISGDTCNSGKGQLAVSASGGIAPAGNYKFLWVPVGMFPKPYEVVQKNLFAGEYKVKVWDENFCLDSATITLPVSGLVFANFDTTIPQPSVPVDVLFTNLTVNGYTYEWHFGDGTDISNAVNPIHTYTEPGDSIQVTMIAWSPEGCVDTAYVWFRLIANPQIEVPNIFTPNSDGSNDFFQVQAKSLKSFHGIIVNRWGKTVYEWDCWEWEKDKEPCGWNGKIKGTGDDASPGIYYYIITGVGLDEAESPFELKGVLYLVREKK